MAEIISFPTPDTGKREALDKVGAAVAAHMSAYLFMRQVYDVPIPKMVRGMCDIMMNDGFDYTPQMIELMLKDPSFMIRMERMIIDQLKKKGWLPEDFS